MAINEAAFIAQMEASSPEEFCRMLREPTGDQERVLRAYFGDNRFQRLHLNAVRNNSNRSIREPKGLVVIIHGIMGAELSETMPDGGSSKIWLNYLDLGLGKFCNLKLLPDGIKGVGDVRATGIMKKFYGELIIALSANWDVYPFWFDWRKSLDLAAAELEVQVRSWARPETPIHIVAHSMGGLVARTFMANYPSRWETMWDKEGEGKKGGRLIMLGTPNHGSFAIPQLITGIEPLLQKLSILDIKHKLPEIRAVANTFPGSFQMLPSSLLNEKWGAFYRPETWANLGIEVSRQHLDDALHHHKRLQNVIDPQRMIYIAGYNQQTICDIEDVTKSDTPEAYLFTLNGDGRVTHEMGRLEGVTTYYVDENHGDLPLNDTIQRAIDQLLEKGAHNLDGLSSTLPQGQPALGTSAELLNIRGNQVTQFKKTVKAKRGPTVPSESASRAELQSKIVNRGESQLLDDLVQDFLGRGSSAGSAAKTKGLQIPSSTCATPYCLNLNLIFAKIQDIQDTDVIVVGHYSGVTPVGAELALDEAISKAYLKPSRSPSRTLGESEQIITQYTQRRVLQGELGELFFLCDPRANNQERLIVLGGMGKPGGFGQPELSVLAEQICWSMGLLGKKKLATVLIGTRSGGGIITDEAVRAFLAGALRAGIALVDDGHKGLETITFVQHNPLRSIEIDQAIQGAKEPLKKRFPDGEIIYTPLEKDERSRLEDLASQPLPRTAPVQGKDGKEPTRVMVTIEEANQMYRYSALTNEATVPERVIPLDPSLVTEANEALAAAADIDEQYTQGRFLEKLLFPNDLRNKIYTDSPLLLTVDSVSARIHWEMLAQTGLPRTFPDNQTEQSDGDGQDEFLGTGRGLTRQLRTPLYVPLPDRMPSQQRKLRVLVVADPAEDAPLPGAEEEGVAVADLFESFKHIYELTSKNSVEVVRLFGPREATRSNLLKRIMLENFDVLHFAGHCLYNSKKPDESGWVFSNGKLLTARELNRVDRIPKFVFSNACESGITNDRAELRSVDLAPSFAESFFMRGVSNFVCTAWPVDDRAALDFALRLYSELLGISESSRNESKSANISLWEPKPMYVAMREARREILNKDYGIRTWGAYQHYGNPHMRFFAARPTINIEKPPKSAQKNTRATSRRPVATQPPPPAQPSPNGKGKKAGK